MPCRSTLSAIWVKYLCGKTDIVPTCSAFEPVERFAEIVLREREEIIDVWESNEGGRRRAGHKAMAKYHPANQPGYAMGIGESER